MSSYSSRTLLGRCKLAKGVITLTDDGLMIISLNFLELSQDAQHGSKLRFYVIHICLLLLVLDNILQL